MGVQNFDILLSMHPLLRRQNTLHSEASLLLEQTLLPILEQYGKVSVGGSYSYKLLNYPDLDIDVVGEDVSKDFFSKLSGELIRLDYTSKFKSADRVNYPHTHIQEKDLLVTGYLLTSILLITSGKLIFGYKNQSGIQETQTVMQKSF